MLLPVAAGNVGVGVCENVHDIHLLILPLDLMGQVHDEEGCLKFINFEKKN